MSIIAFRMFWPNRYESWMETSRQLSHTAETDPLSKPQEHLAVGNNVSVRFPRRRMPHRLWTGELAGDVERDEILTNDDIRDAIPIISHLRKKNVP